MADITWTNEKRTLSQLIPWPRNPRLIKNASAKRLQQSFVKFGQPETIQIGPDDSVYNGHQRLKSWLTEFGDVEVDVRVSSRPLTEKEREKLTVYLHKGATGEFDFDILANEFELDDLLEWGFEPFEFGLEDEKPEPAEDPGAQIDKADELQKAWGTALGQLWQLGDHRLICGDCTDAAVVERLMDGEKAALAWFDPPFGIDLVPPRGLTKRIENDGNVDARALWAKFLPLLHDNLVDNAHAFLCQGWTEFDWTLPLIRKRFTLKSKVVWNKNVWGIGYYTRPKHEDIIYCWKGEPKTIDEPVADVWDVARESAPDHAAEKPPALSAIAIKHFSTMGDIVADWFCGVGGSGIACEQLGRKARMVEISPAYCAVILQRWATMTNKTPVLID